ncbi:MAG: hypothetical protein CL927_12520 [Deltaproteobacteria bacterium]|nr:hypothetical protein [Deltaproteobacteria bacterium]HCH62653.1 hypothetical protein [Deltaproteobacteria bacterium]
MSRPALFALAIVPFAVACGDDPGEAPVDGDSSSAMPYCEDVERALTVDEVTDFGVSGAEFLDQVPAASVGLASFEGMGESTLEVGIVVDSSSLRYVESTPKTPDTGGPVPLIAVHCSDRIEVDAEVTLVSDDGQLAESLNITLSLSDPASGVSEPGALVFRTTLDPSNIVGSLDLDNFMDVDAYDTATLYLEGTIVDQVMVGAFDAMGEITQTGGADAIAMAVLYPVVVFDASPAE